MYIMEKEQDIAENTSKEEKENDNTNNKEQGDELYQDAMVLLLEKRVSLNAEQNSKSYALSGAVMLWKN